MDGSQQVDRKEHAYWTGEWEAEKAATLDPWSARSIAYQWASWLSEHGDYEALEGYGQTGIIGPHLVSLVGAYRHQTTRLAQPLRALIAHVLASEVMVWSYGYNRAGYLPDARPSRVIGSHHALEAWEIFLRELPDLILCPEDDPCLCGQDEAGQEWECEYHRATAFMESIIADRDHVGLPGEDHVTVRVLIDEVPWEAWLHRDTMTVEAYLES